MNRTRLWPQLALLVVLAIGAGLAWGIPAAFLTSMWESHIRRGETPYRELASGDRRRGVGERLYL